jgi:hypothetical protein
VKFTKEPRVEVNKLKNNKKPKENSKRKKKKPMKKRESVFD